VTVAPWVHDASDYSTTNLFQVPNCDDSTTPDAQATIAATNFSTAIGNDNIQCDDGYEDFCNAASNALACLNGALSVAASESPFSLPGDDAGSQAQTYAGDALTAASTYVNSQEAETVVGDGLGFASDLYGAVGTIVSIANAYNSCG